MGMVGSRCSVTTDEIEGEYQQAYTKAVKESGGDLNELKQQVETLSARIAHLDELLAALTEENEDLKSNLLLLFVCWFVG